MSCRRRSTFSHACPVHGEQGQHDDAGTRAQRAGAMTRLDCRAKDGWTAIFTSSRHLAPQYSMSSKARPRGGLRWARWLALAVTLPLSVLLSLVALPLAVPSLFVTQAQAEQVQQFFTSEQNNTVVGTGSTISHTDNWAILIGASRFWFNYRHMANTLGLYRIVKKLGIPDSQIILMLADDIACDSRNRYPGNVWADEARALDLYGSQVEVDYKGREVTVENLIRLLTGRHPTSTPSSKRLLSTSSSNVLLYLTGHGGEDFLKFQDSEELGAWDLADAIAQMHEKKRYNEMLIIVDTCQANSMYSKIYSPNVIAVGSSKVGQNSYSHQNSPDLGIALIDRFTSHLLSYLSAISKTSDKTLMDLFRSFDPVELFSDPGVRTDLFTRRKVEDVRLTDFFGGRKRGVRVVAGARS